ncbi:MAG: fructosamine kinase family protein [Olsenella sp.]|nr:fructosamine kinase family protein [Olsenella sp.]
MESFAKRDERGGASLLGEAAALGWLAAAEAAGGLRVARVLSASAVELVEERITETTPTVHAARAIGEALARTHAAGAPWWGAPPPGWSGSYRIGRSLTPTLERGEAPGSWGSFYAEHRVMCYVRGLRDEGAFSAREAAVFERLAERLASGVYDASQPALVSAAGFDVARLHGDLWAGNLLWDADPSNATGGALIDPMAYGGHAESDLAMLALFGCPHLGAIVDAYDATSPLADGWRERVGLHQVAPLLLHCVLFGGHYLSQALSVARRYA